MIKSELIEKLAAENTHLTHTEVERVVNIVLGRMVDSLGDGGRVELRGFGAFSVRGRPARAGRNPRTGETVDVPAIFQERQGAARAAERRGRLTPPWE